MTLQPQSTSNAKVVVGIGDLQVVKADSGDITTHALGSCIGLTIYDPEVRVAGMLHYLLPHPMQGESVPEGKMGMYATTGLPELFKKSYELGAKRENLIICAAGASNMLEDSGTFQIGRRNRSMLHKLFFRNNLTLAAEETGGTQARTLKIDLATGVVLVRTKGNEVVLWQP